MSGDQDNSGIPITSPPPNGGGGEASWRLKTDQRVTANETELKHAATKSWVLGRIIGGMFLAESNSLAVAPNLF